MKKIHTPRPEPRKTRKYWANQAQTRQETLLAFCCRVSVPPSQVASWRWGPLEFLAALPGGKVVIGHPLAIDASFQGGRTVRFKKWTVDISEIPET